MKILWLSNAHITNKKPKASGTWMYSMANELLNDENIKLYNITQGRVKQTLRDDYLELNQWIVPISKLNRHGLPKKQIVKDIQNIVSTINPDIIHIWGTEVYWGLLATRKLIKGNCLLEIQGLKFEIQKYFYSGMNRKDLISCIGFKEIVKPTSSIFNQKASFKKWGEFEKEIISKSKYISTQSDWVRTHIKLINRNSILFNTKMVLREEFINSVKWSYEYCEPYSIFTSTSSITSYKGLHILLDSIAILKNKFPNLKLYIAANKGREGIFMNGYSKWLNKKISGLNLKEHVIWLGPLNANEMVDHLLKSNVVVIPSFVESYCMALDEALCLGVPTVASFAGAMTELGRHKETVYYFQSGDYVMCANAIEDIFTNKVQISNMTKKPLVTSNSDVDNKQKAQLQINIYNKILNEADIQT